MAKIDDLKKKIIPAFPDSVLGKLEVAEGDRSIFQRYKIFPIDLLVKADWNYKEEDEFRSGKLRENIKRMGQVENIHVRELDTGYYEVINGNHRYDDLVALGKEYVVCYDHGKVSQTEAIRRAIETNETKFATDTLKLAELINQMSEEFDQEDLLSTMPFTEDEWNEFEEIFDFDWDEFEGEPDDSGLDDPTYKVLKFEVPTEVFDKWQEWQSRVNHELGYDSDWKAFEFAIVEALNIPVESLK